MNMKFPLLALFAAMGMCAMSDDVQYARENLWACIEGCDPSHLGNGGGMAITIRGNGLVGKDELLPSVTVGGAQCVVTSFNRSSPAEEHFTCISPQGPEDLPDSEHGSKARTSQVALDVALTTAANHTISMCCPRTTGRKECQRSSRSFTGGETCNDLPVDGVGDATAVLTGSILSNEVSDHIARRLDYPSSSKATPTPNTLRVLDYWTSDRIANATPAGNFLQGTRRSSGRRGPDVAHQQWNRNWGGIVQTAVGRILFRIGEKDSVCSGTVVTETKADRSVVITAAHCVYQNAAFAEDALFIPNQAETSLFGGNGTDWNCNNDPLGCWVPSAGVVDGDWASKDSPGNVPYDYGYYVVPTTGAHSGPTNISDSLEEAAGSIEVSFAAPRMSESTHALGYSWEHDPMFMHCVDDLELRDSPSFPSPMYPPMSPLEVTGLGCTVDPPAGRCVRSTGYGGTGYSPNEACTITNPPAIPISFTSFAVEESSPCNWGSSDQYGDYLTMNGVRYCGQPTVSPEGVVPDGTPIEWRTDSSKNNAGWELCFPLSPAPSVAPPSLLLAGCELSAGSSGGPWIQGNITDHKIVSVNSWAARNGTGANLPGVYAPRLDAGNGGHAADVFMVARDRPLWSLGDPGPNETRHLAGYIAPPPPPESRECEGFECVGALEQFRDQLNGLNLSCIPLNPTTEWKDKTVYPTYDSRSNVERSPYGWFGNDPDSEMKGYVRLVNNKLTNLKGFQRSKNGTVSRRRRRNAPVTYASFPTDGTELTPDQLVDLGFVGDSSITTQWRDGLSPKVSSTTARRMDCVCWKLAMYGTNAALWNCGYQGTCYLEWKKGSPWSVNLAGKYYESCECVPVYSEDPTMCDCLKDTFAQNKTVDVVDPSEVPSAVPTEAATDAPSEVPSAAPTESPTEAPTESPTEAPTKDPNSTEAPTESPTEAPTESPTEVPTEASTKTPSKAPTPATKAPTVQVTYEVVATVLFAGNLSAGQDFESVNFTISLKDAILVTFGNTEGLTREDIELIWKWVTSGSLVARRAEDASYWELTYTIKVESQEAADNAVAAITDPAATATFQAELQDALTENGYSGTSISGLTLTKPTVVFTKGPVTEPPTTGSGSSKWWEHWAFWVGIGLAVVLVAGIVVWLLHRRLKIPSAEVNVIDGMVQHTPHPSNWWHPFRSATYNSVKNPTTSQARHKNPLHAPQAEHEDKYDTMDDPSNQAPECPDRECHEFEVDL